MFSRAASACSLMTCDASFFDTNGDATDGCKAPGGAVDNGACNTGSAAAVGACSSVTCNANFVFDTNGEAADG